ncbi:MAG: hypothetical protein LBU81_07515 [Methanosarcinales archaeon]|jgi:hypothetical protein|nr:hypothetical protein [Methanosarcinales archaeon]
MAEIQKDRHSKVMSRLFILMILLSSIFFTAAPAAAEESNAGNYFSDEYIMEIINSTPAVDAALFEKAKSNEKTISVSGTVPVLAEGRESYEWFVLLQSAMRKTNDEGKLEPYLWDNGGFIIGYGCPTSHIQVSVHADADYSEEDINAIIQIIQDAGKAYNIDNVPIVIEEDDHVHHMSETEKTTPGVGLLSCVLLSLAVVFFIQRARK